MKKLFIIAVVALAGGAFWLGQKNTLPEETPENKIVDEANNQGKVIHRNDHVAVEDHFDWKSHDDMMPPLKELAPSIAKIIGREGDKDFIYRNNLVKELKALDLNPADYQALYVFLQEKVYDKDGKLFYHAVKNDIMTFLVERSDEQEKLGGVLADIMADKKQHQVMREYTIQFIPAFYEKNYAGKSQFTPREEEDKRRLEKVMWDLLNEDKGALAGTSLLMIYQLSKKYQTYDMKEVYYQASLMAADTGKPVASRMGALEIAAKSGDKDEMGKIREIAMDEEAPVSLRMIAIYQASSKQKKDEELKTYLIQNILKKSKIDKRLKMAANPAVQRLNGNKGYTPKWLTK